MPVFITGTPSIMRFIFTVLFIIILIIVVWHLLTKKYVNPYKLFLFFGKKGCGKSTLLQKLVYYYTKLGYRCYCNIGDSSLNNVTPIDINDLPSLALAYSDLDVRYDLFVKYYSRIDPNYSFKSISSDCKEAIIKVLRTGKQRDNDFNYPDFKLFFSKRIPIFVKPHSVIFCDEINLLWDNRDFKSFPKELQRYFRLQRHYKHVFIGFSQTYDCDKKIRDLADELFIVKRTARVWIHCKSYIKKVVVVSPDDDNARETATMTDDFIPRGLLYDLTSPFNAWLPQWVKVHDSYK